MVFLSALFAVALAQEHFDVASIKFHKEPIEFSADPAIRGRRVVATASTLHDLITYAYGVRYDQITGGPSWAGSEHYDLAATAEGDGTLSPAQARTMVRNLLAERFQLKVHRETFDGPVYTLTVGKNGPKFKQAPPDREGGNVVGGDARGLHMDAPKGTMADLVKQLSVTAGRPVVDRTGLAGRYTFTLDWFPANRIAPPELDAPTMFDAVQNQLGLKLESTTGPRERLVIDGAVRPSAN